VDPENGAPGTSVQVYGTGFASSLSNNAVTIGGSAATVSNVNPGGTVLTVLVPDVTGGPANVSVSVNGGPTSTLPGGFTVLTGGSGTFDNTLTPSFPGTRQGSLTFADIDGDADADLLITGEDSGANPFTGLYRNTTTGFANVTGALPAVEEGDADFGDVDGDGDLDLLLAGTLDGQDTGSTTSLYINDGNGGYSAGGLSLAYGRYGTVRFADVDGDGDLDFFSSGRNSSRNLQANLYLNDGSGTFIASGVQFLGVDFSDADFGDIDRDGDLDLIVTGRSGNNRTANLYVNDGSGGFAAQTTSIVGVRNGSADFADIDGDGDLDLAVTGEEAFNTPSARIYVNDGTGTFFVQTPSVLTPLSISSAVWGDFDGDADPDLIVLGDDGSSFGSETALLYRNDGSGGFTEVPQDGTDLSQVSGGAIAAGDYDGDGDLDAILSGRSSSGTSLTLASENVGAPALLVSGPSGPLQESSALDFGATVVGVPVTFSLTLENDPAAGAELEITGATLSGPDAGAFDIVPRASFPNTLQPGRSTTVDVTLTAQTTGALRAQLAFESTDPASPFTLTLAGRVGDVFVWPGDANNSGIASPTLPDVSTDDLLPIGLCFGVEGPARPGGYDATWEEQPALIFGFPPNEADPCQVGAAGSAFTDPVFADATGDGRIDGRDVIPIGVNFGRSRTSASGTTVASIMSSPSSRRPPVSRLRLPPPARGSMYTMSVRLNETPGDVFGISAQIRLPANTYEIASLKAGHGLHEESPHSDLLSMHDYRQENGVLRAAFSRKRVHGSARGHGPLFHVRLRALQTANEPAVIDLETATLSRAKDGLRRASSATLISKDAVSSAAAAPGAFWVGAPSPHPARTQSSLTYRLPRATTVRVTLFDALGRKVAQLTDGQQGAGTQRLTIAASTLSSGMYFVRVAVDGNVETRRLTVVR